MKSFVARGRRDHQTEGIEKDISIAFFLFMTQISQVLSAFGKRHF